ncbi:acetoacetate decarboxylase family protein, partial [Burkholderia pseudomallei]|uniref:acetoacetate decarboxylase family protein n=1 Tax=Burkholderia pseudomallei TaxID=28450 RepID=UPI003C7C9A8D
MRFRRASDPSYVAAHARSLPHPQHCQCLSFRCRKFRNNLFQLRHRTIDSRKHTISAPRQRSDPQGVHMKPSQVRSKAFAMPLTSPAFPMGPYRFVNREFLIITYRTDMDRLREIVPEPLEVKEPLVHLRIFIFRICPIFDRLSAIYTES